MSPENMLNSEFRKLEASVDRELNLNGQKIRDAISAHTAALKEQLETLNGAVNAQFAGERTGPAAGRAALEADQRADTVR
ncbi:MbeB family mobilization protein [Escherichia coli]|uniref:MbeB family mobilization protein n=1 Tax=Escherichia coli TaxID=562 RepID=UPI003D7FB703